eukprot:6192586-Pleurochrysis_carterae.AAC.1
MLLGSKVGGLSGALALRSVASAAAVAGAPPVAAAPALGSSFASAGLSAVLRGFLPGLASGAGA